MGNYRYYVRDFFLNAGNYPLAGEHYRCLLQHCFRYSSYISFKIPNPYLPVITEIEKWQVHDIDGVFSVAIDMNTRFVYYACEGILHAMLTWVDDLFDMYTLNNHVYPEDPVFIRDDGSVFFDSIIHEGECSLYPREGEDIMGVLKYGHWLYINEQGHPEVPAKEHQFPIPSLQTICNDQLYRDLIAMRQCPDAYISSQSVEEISRYVDSYRPHFLKNARHLPPGISCIPRWYSAFEMYILGECDAFTSSKIATALENAGYCAISGFVHYFELLEQYINLSKKHHDDSSQIG